MLSKVIETYKQRRKRKHFFHEDVFGEPAWDMLLDLFAARMQDRRISVTSACYASDVPPTTALRWLGVLEEIGYIERLDNASDQRVTWVRLTDLASQAMQEYFEEFIKYVDKQHKYIDEYLVTKK
jgi:DNA-binding MarR family transcriptional regulator